MPLATDAMTLRHPGGMDPVARRGGQQPDGATIGRATIGPIAIRHRNHRPTATMRFRPRSRGSDRDQP